jgi:polyhydroxyalkanoate synthesis repressor PhaR
VVVIIKKYANRRLYATDESRYVSLAELAEKIRSGTDVQVIDAKTGDDLTQPILTQIVIEHRGAGKLLSVRLLTQMIRLGDDAFSEFVGQFMTDGMEMYQQMRSGVGRVASLYPVNPFLGGKNVWTAWMDRWRGPDRSARAERSARGSSPAPAPATRSQPDPEPAPEPEPAPAPEPAPQPDGGSEPRRADDISALRAELDELKHFIRDALSDRK